MLTTDQQQMIQNLKERSKLTEKDLMILLIDSVDELIRIIEKQEEMLEESQFLDYGYDPYIDWEY